MKYSKQTVFKIIYTVNRTLQSHIEYCRLSFQFLCFRPSNIHSSWLLKWQYWSFMPIYSVCNVPGKCFPVSEFPSSIFTAPPLLNLKRHGKRNHGCELDVKKVFLLSTQMQTRSNQYWLIHQQMTLVTTSLKSFVGSRNLCFWVTKKITCS